MTVSKFEQKEKIKYLHSVLLSLSDSSSKKGIYSLAEVARALYLKMTTDISWRKLPLSEHYRTHTAFGYWWKKLKTSGRFQEVKKVMSNGYSNKVE